MYDATNDYDDSFHVGGCMLILAGLLFSLLHLPYFRRLQKKNEQDIPYSDEPTKESLIASGEDKHGVGNGSVVV